MGPQLRRLFARVPARAQGQRERAGVGHRVRDGGADGFCGGGGGVGAFDEGEGGRGWDGEAREEEGGGGGGDGRGRGGEEGDMRRRGGGLIAANGESF